MKQPEIARLESAGANPRLSTLKRVVAATGHSLKLDLDEEFGLDETLIAGSLRETPDERMRGFESLYRFARSSAARPSGPMDPKERIPAEWPPLDAREILRRLTAAGIDFVVIGGIAMVLLGYPGSRAIWTSSSPTTTRTWTRSGASWSR